MLENRIVKYILLSGVFLCILFACSGTKHTKPFSTSEDVYWPPLPAKARVRFIGTITGIEDFGISQGFSGFLKRIFIGDTKPRIIKPMAFASNGEGVLYVADTGAGRIHRFDTLGKKYEYITRDDRMPFPSPVGLFEDSKGVLYVVDSELRKIFKAEPDSEKAVAIKSEGDFIRPTAIAFDQERNRLYVLDTGAHRVEVLRPDGTRLFIIGRRGNEDGEFNFPTSLWLNRDGNIYVSDSMNFRVQVFNPEGGIISKFGQAGNSTGDFFRPKGIAVDRRGHIYVVETLFHSVQVFDISGNFLLNFGEQGSGADGFWLPTGIFIDQSDHIYVADSYNRRIQIFQYIGGDND